MSFRVAFTLEGDKDLIAALQKLHGRMWIGLCA